MEFRSNLNDVLRQVSKQEQRGLEAVAIEVAGEAKRRTPVDTGRLRASIAWAAGEAPRQHEDEVEGKDGKVYRSSYVVGAEEGSALVGSNVKYAAAVHERTHAHHEVGEAKFIENAFNEKASRAQQLMELALRGLL